MERLVKFNVYRPVREMDYVQLLNFFDRLGGRRESAESLRKNKKPSGKSLQEGRFTVVLEQVNGSMVEAKREVCWKGASTTGLFTLKLGDKKEGKEKKDNKKVFNNVLFYLIPWF